jgi:hypothetical protein
MEPNRPGNSGRYLSVLKCDSEYGLSLEQCGREWLLVTAGYGNLNERAIEQGVQLLARAVESARLSPAREKRASADS